MVQVPLLTAAAASENTPSATLRKAPKATVDKLPTRTYTADAGVKRECYICLDNYSQGAERERARRQVAEARGKYGGENESEGGLSARKQETGVGGWKRAAGW